MSSKQSKYTVRVDSKLLDKFRFVADYNGRSGNKELEFLIKMHIIEFEKSHGKIEIK